MTDPSFPLDTPQRPAQSLRRDDLVSFLFGQELAGFGCLPKSVRPTGSVRIAAQPLRCGKREGEANLSQTLHFPSTRLLPTTYNPSSPSGFGAAVYTGSGWAFAARKPGRYLPPGLVAFSGIDRMVLPALSSPRSLTIESFSLLPAPRPLVIVEGALDSLHDRACQEPSPP